MTIYGCYIYTYIILFVNRINMAHGGDPATDPADCEYFLVVTASARHVYLLYGAIVIDGDDNFSYR